MIERKCEIREWGERNWDENGGERMEMREGKIPNILKVVLKIIKSNDIQILEYGQNSKEVGDVKDLLVLIFQISVPMILYQTVTI